MGAFYPQIILSKFRAYEKSNPASVYSCTGSPSGRSYPVYFHFLYEETRSDSDQALFRKSGTSG